MRKNSHAVTLFLAALVLSLPLAGGPKASTTARKGKEEIAASGPAVLWRYPTDISSRNLFWGPGGEKDQPHGPYTFVKEDLDGTNPKFIVTDADGVKWKVKLGEEARPETAASRLVWAVGYFANEDYFLPDLQVAQLPRLHRGQSQVGPGGSFHNVRLKRYLKGEKKIGSWEWRADPFSSTTELNGLRVAMALINNWDLKDENNSVYEYKHGEDGPEQVYMVSDLGASFGTPGRSWTRAMSKGNLHAYSHSKFIAKATSEYVDFQFPTRPAFIYLVTPREYFSRVHLRWIGKHIPRDDAKWVGQLLAQLSPAQVSDAFRAAGYSPADVAAFTAIVEARIAELTRL
jgi:hypothetical protein